MTGAFAAAALLLAASAAPSAAGRGQADPAPSDNLRIYMFLAVPEASLALDGGPPDRLTGMSVNFRRLDPGRHEASVALPDGETAAVAFTLNPDDLISSKGRRWWCLMIGRRDVQLTIFQPTTAQCQSITDDGPD